MVYDWTGAKTLIKFIKPAGVEGENLLPPLRGITVKVSKGAKIRNLYNQVPHPTQDTNGKVKSKMFWEW